jgi:hypothetical protein
MVAVCKDLCAFASLRLGVKFLCRPAGAEIYFGLGATNMPRRTALGSAGFSPLQCANWRGVGKFLRVRLGVRRSGVNAALRGRTQGGRRQRLAVRQHAAAAAKGSLGWTKGGARASRVRVWASRPNHWWNHSVWETGFRRDAENGNRDGRAPQQKPSRAAKGSLGWTTIEESGRTGGIGKKLLK